MNATKLFMLCLGTLAAAHEDACVADTNGNCVSASDPQEVLQGAQLIQMKNMLQRKESQRHHESEDKEALVEKHEDKNVTVEGKDKEALVEEHENQNVTVEGKDTEQVDPVKKSPPPSMKDLQTAQEELVTALAGLAGTDKVHQEIGALMMKLENTYWDQAGQQDLRQELTQITSELGDKIKSKEFAGEGVKVDEQVGAAIEKLARFEELLASLKDAKLMQQDQNQARHQKRMLLMELGLLKMRREFATNGLVGEVNHRVPLQHHEDQRKVIKLMDKQVESLMQKIDAIH